MEHFYENIQGWFTFPNLYKQIVNHYPSDSHFVEIGVWKGKSAAYMATEIFNSGKNIKFDCIDTWEGSEEHLDPTSNFFEPNLVQDKDWLFTHFLDNIKPVRDVIYPIRKPSLEAVQLYQDESLDFVFIDASHDYDNVLKDIQAWYPKTKTSTGIISGHDYSWSLEVKKAVHDFFDPLGLTIQEQEGCWIVIKNPQ
jgi:predicted O-methyltransferase YrrM